MKEIASYKNPLYNTYKGMIGRCYFKGNSNYKNYGGRGITVCDRWREPKGQGFRNFLVDMGLRPQETTIDRIDNNRGYSPGNCRWSTRKKQLENRRLYTKNVSGFPGVTENKKGQWRAYHTIGRKFVHLGYFDTMNEAIIAKCKYVIDSLT